MSNRATLVEFETPEGNMLVSSATLLQCLRIAVDEYRLPPLDNDWLDRAHAAIGLPRNTHMVRIGPLAVDFKEVDAHLESRTSMLASVRNAVENLEGEITIKGTDVPAYQIAALAQSLSIEEIMTDYPSLNRSQIEGAIGYALAYPKKGRPYPGTTMKRALGKLVDLGVFDDDMNDNSR